MACRGPEDYEIDAKSKHDYKNEVDKLTRMLCSLCKYVDDWHTVPVSCLNDIDDIKMELIDWWEEHQELDEKRAESLKINALAKLTTEEKKVLGLL